MTRLRLLHDGKVHTAENSAARRMFADKLADKDAW